MKRIFLLFLTFLFILYPINSVAHAEEEVGPPVALVENFDPHYLELFQDGKYQVGVFMDEEDYSFYTKLKIEFNYVQEKLKIFETYSDGLDKIVQDHKILSENMLKDMENVKKMVEKAQDSWWDENKFYIGIAAGALVTGLIIAGANAL